MRSHRRSEPLLADLFAAADRRGVLGAGLVLAALAVLPGCSEVKAEPRRIRWGRDTCDFCHMVFADRRFAAEIWDAELGRARLYDDFGCSVLAAAETGVLGRAEVPWWVLDDADPDRWLDARAARYRGDVVTPMGYGHSAGAAADHPLSFAAAAAAIRDKAECEHKS